MKIVVFGASNSKKSINKQLAVFASTYFAGNEIEILDLNDYELPLFSVDLEAEIGYHPNAIRFYEKLHMADLIIVSMAEHNGSYTAAFKNLLDWMSRYEGKVFASNYMLLLSTSDGGRGGKNVMEAALTRFPRHDARIIGHYSFPKFYDNFTPGEGINNPELKAELEAVIAEVKQVLAKELSDSPSQ